MHHARKKGSRGSSTIMLPCLHGPHTAQCNGLTHIQRWHAAHRTVGYGHVYQGRYKSFPVQIDEHFLQVARYIERTPLRAMLVEKSQAWQWSSLWLRMNGSKKSFSTPGRYPPGTTTHGGSMNLTQRGSRGYPLRHQTRTPLWYG